MVWAGGQGACEGANPAQPLRPCLLGHPLQSDTTTLKAGDVGVLNRLELRIETSGSSTKWYLDQLQVRDDGGGIGQVVGVVVRYLDQLQVSRDAHNSVLTPSLTPHGFWWAHQPARQRVELGLAQPDRLHSVVWPRFARLVC